jgi:hypothetical protein
LKIAAIVGARPNFVKIALIVAELRTRPEAITRRFSGGAEQRTTRGADRCNLELDVTAKPSTDLAGITLPVNACQDNYEVFKRSVPEDVGESSEKNAAGSGVAFRVAERAIRDARDCVADRFPKLSTKALTLTVIPVLDRCYVELGCSTEEDGERQRGRCSRRALTSDQGL